MPLNKLDDRSLVTLALGNDQQAFSMLLHRYKKAIASHIQQQYAVGDAAEDLLLITFDKAFRKLDTYKPDFAFSTWLYTIAQNTCIDHIRKQQRPHLNIAGADSTEYNADPESQMIASQEAARLIYQIKRLKSIYRKPVQLRYLHDYAYEDIAVELSIPLGTVKTRIHRAKEILIQWITPL